MFLKTGKTLWKRYNVRPANLSIDMIPMLEADITSFVNHFEESDFRFIDRLDSASEIVVAEKRGGSVDGFAVITDRHGVITINRICVHASRRRDGAATALVDSLVRRLRPKTPSIVVSVPETMMTAVKFFRGRSFFCERIKTVCGIEMYEMWFRCDRPSRYRWEGRGYSNGT